MRRTMWWALPLGLGGVLAILVAAGVLPGYSARPGPRATEVANDGQQEVVQRATIVSVVTLQATVVTQPVTTITAPASGTVVEFTKNGFRFRSGGHTRLITLPGNTEVVSKLVAPGRDVLANLPIATARAAGFGLRAPVDGATLVRFYGGSLGDAKGQIDKGPGPFTCPLVNGVPTTAAPDPPTTAAEPSATPTSPSPVVTATATAGPSPTASPRRTPESPAPTRTSSSPAPSRTSPSSSRPATSAAEASTTEPARVGIDYVARLDPSDPAADTGQISSDAADSGLALTCVVPSGVRVFAGMSAVLAVSTGERADVLSLPVEAVAGTAGSGKVTVKTPGGWRSHSVTLGITDGVRVEITQGLQEGDVVRLPAPNLDGLDP